MAEFNNFLKTNKIPNYDELLESMENVAKEDTLVSGITEIREDIANIDVDTSNLAKQGSNANANISDIQALIGYTISEIDNV